MTKPDDIPQDAWDESFHEMDCHCPAVMFGDDHLELSVHTAIARAIMAAKAEEREASALVVEVECDRILSKQDGRDATVDSNIRMIACILPDLADAIRKRGEAD